MPPSKFTTLTTTNTSNILSIHHNSNKHIRPPVCKGRSSNGTPCKEYPFKSGLGYCHNCYEKQLALHIIKFATTSVADQRYDMCDTCSENRYKQIYIRGTGMVTHCSPRCYLESQ
jgi:hypothetical protein